MGMSENKRHLDWLAAHYAQNVIAKTKGEKPSNVDNTVTKALGILQENGIYACALFLKSRPQNEKNRADVLMAEMLHLLEELGFGWGLPRSSGAQDVLQHLSDKVIGGNLERLLLAKETLEQMLVYARYGAKAQGAEESE